MSNIMSHPVPAVTLLLGLLVFVHEFGHYIVGRAQGIAVEIFSIGFGPRLIGFNWRGTAYQICIIPLGGYVKFAGAMRGEDIPEGLQGKPFHSASLGKRAATVVAGPLANFLLAVLVFSVLGYYGVPHPPAVIGEVIEGSRAEAAGVLPGDRFVAIDGLQIKTWRDLEKSISSSPEKTLRVTLERDGEKRDVSLTPAATETKNIFGKIRKIGRAGVARGTLPPVLTVLSQDSLASLAGLRQGDVIQRVLYGNSQENISSFPEFQTLISTLVRDPQGPSEITLVAAPWTKEQKTASDGSPSREVKLSLSAVRARLGQGIDGRGIMKSLGLGDAQLTIGELPTEGQTSNPAASSLKPGDTLVAVKDQPLRDLFDLQEFLLNNTDQVLPFTIRRDFEEEKVMVTLEGVEVQKPDGVGTIYILPVTFMGTPIEPEPLYEVYKNPIEAVAYGFRETRDQTLELASNVYQLITGEVPLKALGGPMLIAKVAGESAKRGWQTFLGSMALISVNLGLLNLFPIPVLDGGQLVMMAFEGIRRRPLSEIAIENFQKIGFAMIMALVVLATYNDLSRFWKSMLSSVVGLFQ